MGLGFEYRIHCVSVVGTHRNLGHIDVAVTHSGHHEIFLSGRFATGSKLSDCSKRCCLRSLTASIRVDFGVEYQDIHVVSAGQNMVQATIADVVSPTVATDDPNALL